ncbi:MAG: hypothetical protein ACI3Y5_00655 [Prevotella sp.]
MINENDTLTAKQHNENQANAERMKTKDAMIAKILAGTGAGMVAGAGAAYAANQYINSENSEANTDEPQENAQTQQDGKGQEEKKPTVEERLSELEEKERVRQQQEHIRQQQEAERQRREAERQRHEEERARKEEEQLGENKPEGKPEARTEGKQENDFFREHDVKIEEVEPCQIPDGRTVNIYYGTVDGHDAAFADDGNGRITTAIVDENDNGDIDNNERIDLSSRNISAQDMAQHKIEQPQDEHEVTVVSVQNNVNWDGETVDVATVVIDDTPAMLIDRTQDGEVNVIIADRNHNGVIDDGEAGDISQSHIPMPTSDDINNNLTACGDDGMTDYSNDADTTVYEI